MLAVLFMSSRVYGRIYKRKHISPIQFRLSRSKPTAGPIFFDMDLAGDVACADKSAYSTWPVPLWHAMRLWRGSKLHRIVAAETAFEYFIISPVTQHAHATSVSWRRHDAIIDDRYHSDSSAASIARRHTTALGNGQNKIFISVSRRSKITCFKVKTLLKYCYGTAKVRMPTNIRLDLS